MTAVDPLSQKEPTSTHLTFHLAHAYTLRCSHMCECVPIQNSQMDYNQNRNYATRACLKLFPSANTKEKGRFSLT